MIRAQCEDKEILITFVYPKHIMKRGGRWGRPVICKVFKTLDTIEANGKPTLKLIECDYAVCSNKDQYNRIKGRKVALAHVLNKMKASDALRQTVWNAYFKECKK